MSKTTDETKPTNYRRKGRRSSAKAVFFRDAEAGLTVYAPKKPGDRGEDGAFRARFKDPVTGKVRQPRLRGTPEEVRTECLRIVGDIEARRTSDWRTVTFRQLGDAYLADPDHDWEPTARRHQEQKLRTLCDETKLGPAELGDIVYSSKFVRDALKQLAATTRPRTGRPFAQASLKTYRDLVGTVFAWGQREEYIPQELAPMRGVGVPKAAPGAKLSVRDRALTEDEDGTEADGLILNSEMPPHDLVEALGDIWSERAPYRPWWRKLSVDFAATSGPRWGEHHALRPVDFRFDADNPHVRIHRKLLVDAKGSVVGTSLPKGGKRRDSIVADHLVDRLQRRAAEVTKEHGPRGLMFPSPKDPTRPYEPDSFGTSMRNFARQAGWPEDEHGLLVWTWHSLRHVAAVWALRDVGIDEGLVSRSLGHASINFTRARYVGPTGDSHRIAAEQMRAWAKKNGLA